MMEEKTSNNQELNQQEEYNFLAYSVDTWGNYGQHNKTIKLIVDLDQKTQTPLWKILSAKWVINDSRKNLHREAYVKEEELTKLKGKILKEVNDYQSSSRHRITTKYYYIDEGLKEIKSENSVKINGKYYDVLEVNGRKVLINKDEVIVQ